MRFYNGLTRFHLAGCQVDENFRRWGVTGLQASDRIHRLPYPGMCRQHRCDRFHRAIHHKAFLSGKQPYQAVGSPRGGSFITGRE
jgi:hypothetical protein